MLYSGCHYVDFANPRMNGLDAFMLDLWLLGKWAVFPRWVAVIRIFQSLLASLNSLNVGKPLSITTILPTCFSPDVSWSTI